MTMTRNSRQPRALTALITIVFILGILIPDGTQAQAPAQQELTPVVGHSLYNDTSPALRDMIKNIPAPVYQVNQAPQVLRELPKAAIRQAQGTDGALQQESYPNDMPLPVASFDGIANPQGYIPPDTNGDIGYDPATGSKYYFQTVNVSFRFWDVTDPSNPVPVTGVMPGSRVQIITMAILLACSIRWRTAGSSASSATSAPTALTTNAPPSPPQPIRWEHGTATALWCMPTT
jgi:hypothetical protein